MHKPIAQFEGHVRLYARPHVLFQKLFDRFRLNLVSVHKLNDTGRIKFWFVTVHTDNAYRKFNPNGDLSVKRIVL